MPRALVVAALMLLTTGAASAVEGEAAASRGFGGRSGATKVKLIVVCAIPDPDAKAQGGFVTGLAARIIDANRQAHEKRLRAMVENWRLGDPTTRPMTMEELLKTVPPKYHAAIKEYFEKLKKMERDAKKCP